MKVVDALGPLGFGSYALEWANGQPQLERVHAAPESLLAPGFVDVHIHGGLGEDFMAGDLEGNLRLCRFLAAQGYEAFLPTTITASPADVLRALEALPDDPRVVGFHLEGPFLSPKHPGAQPPTAIVEPPSGPSEWDPVLNHPALRLVTLAPEVPHGLELVRRLDSRGVIASMGHTDATFEQAKTGFEFGARHATHTYNAMRGLHHREAGTVGYVLQNDAMTCELIYDRVHVSPPAAALLLRNKPLDKVVAVSDSTRATGMPPGESFTMWGLRVVAGKGEVRLADSGALAGSAITLLDAFQNLAEDFGAETAIRCTSLNPRQLLAMPNPPRVWLELDPKTFELVTIHRGDA